MTRAWIRVSAGLLCLLLNFQLCEPLEIFDKVISTRRLELVKMKAVQWAPLLQRINNSLQRNLRVNATCLKHMQLFVDSMILQDNGGLELLDSLGSLPSGILRGSLVDAGSHEECFSANVTDDNGGSGMVPRKKEASGFLSNDYPACGSKPFGRNVYFDDKKRSVLRSAEDFTEYKLAPWK
ncbi:uncharacterized protein LOC142558374 [Dermacentor variabilis]|uniref:uncharacterized protein LOC142558374 n=1 Tax=Dermacentor variabilis TaxID=34621 RepID=UPI003F5C7A99